MAKGMNWGRLRDRDNIRKRGSESIAGDEQALKLAARLLAKQLPTPLHSRKPQPIKCEGINPFVPLQPPSVKIRCFDCGHVARFQPTVEQAAELSKLAFKCKKCGGTGRIMPKLADAYPQGGSTSNT